MFIDALLEPSVGPDFVDDLALQDNLRKCVNFRMYESRFGRVPDRMR